MISVTTNSEVIVTFLYPTFGNHRPFIAGANQRRLLKAAPYLLLLYVTCLLGYFYFPSKQHLASIPLLVGSFLRIVCGPRVSVPATSITSVSLAPPILFLEFFVLMTCGCLMALRLFPEPDTRWGQAGLFMLTVGVCLQVTAIMNALMFVLRKRRGKLS